MTIDSGLLRADIPLVQTPFDGTGGPYRGSSARGWTVVVIVIVVVLAVIWATFSDALSIFDPAPPGPYGPAPIDVFPAIGQ